MAALTAEFATISKESEVNRRETVSGPRTPQPTSEPDAGFSGRVLGGAPEQPPVDETVQVLSSHDLSRPVNSAIRIATMHRAQRTHGNHFVQRLANRLQWTPSVSGHIQRDCACGGTCEQCRRAAPDTPPTMEFGPSEPGRLVQAQPASSPGTGSSAVLKANLIPAESEGRPIDEKTRRLMEPHFGAEFSDIRVHTDNLAERSADAVEADAYTSGKDIYFAAGKYAPDTSDGRHLLAHELTHTLQQKNGGTTPATSRKNGTIGAEELRLSEPNEPLELEAERTAEAFANGSPVHPASSAAAGVIQRQENPPPAAPSPVQTPPGAGPAAPGLSPDDARKLIVARSVLSQVKPMDDAARATLSKALPNSACYALIKKRDEKLKLLNEKKSELEVATPENGVPDEALAQKLKLLADEVAELSDEVNSLNESIAAILQEQDIPGKTSEEREQNLITFVTKTFPEMFENRGKEIVKAELGENAKIARDEADRYKNICTESGNGDPIKNRDGLRAAAADLSLRESEIGGIKDELAKAKEHVPIAGVDAEASEKVNSLNDRLTAKQTELAQQRKAYGIRYPILLRENIVASSLASASDEELNEIVGGEIDTVLKDIDETVSNVDQGNVRIWDLKDPKTGFDLVAITKQDLGVEGQALLEEAITNYIADIKSDEAALNLAITALTITATIIATAAGGPLAGALVGAAFGTIQLARDIETYSELSAASNIALDPDLAKMSREEPSIFWIALDIVFVIADLNSAKSAISAMKGPARKLIAGGTIAEFGEQARELAPAAADRLVQSAERQVAVRELEGGAKLIAQEAEGEGRVLARSFTAEGHELEVTAEGIERCSDKPCPVLRTVFSEELAKRPDLEKELQLIEKQAKTDAEAAAKAAVNLEAKLVAEKTVRMIGPELAAKLEKLGLSPEAIQRVLAKGTDVGNVKGRLFDELFAAEAQKRMATKAGKEELAGGKLSAEVAKKLEFWPGSQITDAAGEELTDGILGYREGKNLHLINVYEAKAGRRAATQLRLLEERMARLPANDLAEVRKLAAEEMQELEALAKKAGKPVGITIEELEKDLLKYRVQKQLGGQVRETIERLDVMVDLAGEANIPTRIKINGEELNVVGVSGKTKVTGVLPSDVKAGGIKEALAKEKLNFDVMPLAVKQDQIDKLAKEISEAAKMSAAAK